MFKDVYEKGLVPYRRKHIYDQLLSRIRAEHLQIGKQIGKLLDMPKGPQAQKHICWVFGHLKVQKVDFVDYVRNEAMLVLVLTLKK